MVSDAVPPGDRFWTTYVETTYWRCAKGRIKMEMMRRRSEMDGVEARRKCQEGEKPRYLMDEEHGDSQ